MGTQDWRIQLEEEEPPAPLVLWEPQPEAESDDGARSEMRSVTALLSAVCRLGRQSDGMEPGAWIAPLTGDPIAFLIDSTGDAVNVWGPRGQLLFRNRCAAQLDLRWPSGTHVERLWIAGRRFERRCLAFPPQSTTYLLDVVRELR